jgi:hypothetical protein
MAFTTSTRNRVHSKLLQTQGLKEMTDGGKAGFPFSGGFSSWYGQGFFKPKSLRSEDQTETFSLLVSVICIGKLSSLLGIPKIPSAN